MDPRSSNTLFKGQLCVYVCIYVCVYVCVYMYVCVGMCEYKYVCIMHVYACVDVYTHPLCPYLQPHHPTGIILPQLSDWLTDSKAISYSLYFWTSLEHWMHINPFFLNLLCLNISKSTLHSRLTSHKCSFITSLLCWKPFMFPHWFMETLKTPY